MSCCRTNNPASTTHREKAGKKTVAGGDDYWKLWIATQCIDYAFAAAMCYSTVYGMEQGRGMVGGGDDFTTIISSSNEQGQQLKSWNLAKILIRQAFVAVGLIYFREEIHFWMLRGRLGGGNNKRQGSLTYETWYHVAQTAVFSQTSFFCLGMLGLMNYVEPEWTRWTFWARVYAEFYAMLVLRDVFSLAPFHSLMHNNPRWYNILHKKHHQVRRDAQAMHAFHIDLIDLVLENTGAPTLLLLVQYLYVTLMIKGGVGEQQQQPPPDGIGVHWFAVSLLTSHDGSLHSINPYSAMYFNPLLDHLMKGTICHQLHHALNKGYILFVPYRHLWSPAARRADIDKYRSIFKQDLAVR